MRWSLRCLAAALLVVVACGKTPTAPTQNTTPPPPPPPPAPIPAAQLQSTGNWTFTNCDQLLGYNCHISISMENAGEGCATSTTAVLRLYDSNDNEIGTPLQMAAIAGVLASALIRPGEILELISVNPLPTRALHEQIHFTRLFPTWTDVRC